MSIFTRVPLPKIPKSLHNLSHPWLGTGKMGVLIPIFWRHAIPSEVYRDTTECRITLKPLEAPAMVNIDVSTFTFFVPDRLIHDNSQKYWTIIDSRLKPGSIEDDDVEYPPVRPKIQINGVTPGSLADYLGLAADDPFGNKINGMVSAMPFRAYQKIFNDYFRSKELEPEVPLYTGDHDVTQQLEQRHLQLRTRLWRKDYFTSALRTPQAGPDVRLPLGTGVQPLSRIQDEPLMMAVDGNTGAYGSTRVRRVSGSGGQGTDAQPDEARLGLHHGLLSDENFVRNFKILADNYGIDLDVLKQAVGLDLSNIPGITITEERKLHAIQRILELMSWSGPDYPDQLRVFFGIQPDDARMQRPEIISITRSPLMISPVMQMSQSNPDAPLGDLAGHGSMTTVAGSWRFRAKEHGIIMTLLCVNPQPMYTSAVQREWFKDDILDYLWPQLSNIGEQEIWQGEIWPYGDSSEWKNLFGWSPRYSEYKYYPGSVHGDFMKETMAHWHLARMFQNKPVLNSEFVRMNPSQMSRIFADTSGQDDHMQIQLFHRLKALEPCTKYGVR